MGLLLVKKLLWGIFWVLKKIVESIITLIIVGYIVLVFDIYINTEKLINVDSSINSFCQNVASNPKFTKRPVVFRIDRGTLVFRLQHYLSMGDLAGYSPFFIFPHHRTVVLSKDLLKMNNATLIFIVAHELGHIEGGLKHFGSVNKMEKYANDFSVEVVKTQP